MSHPRLRRHAALALSSGQAPHNNNPTCSFFLQLPDGDVLTTLPRDEPIEAMVNNTMWACTCEAPPTIDLTGTLNGENISQAESLSMRTIMARWGWLHVSLDLDSLNDASPLDKLAFDPPAMKQMIQDMFDSSVVTSNPRHAFYRGRTSESGASNAEAKQSWEVQRCSGDSPDGPLNIVHKWTEALHSISVTVTRILKLPPDVLIRDQHCECLGTRKCNVDLLRVFLYDAVDEDGSLGSSPHTDWGSFTVVWQDDVGGLQTYCHSHQKWIDVQAPSVQKKTIRFVVHVGDVTSLAMGHAIARLSPGKKKDSELDSVVVTWPSPKHRVRSPMAYSGLPRASLVYFAYPPPGVSLDYLENALEPFVKTEELTVAIPYEEYFVLRSQSPGDEEHCHALPNETYNTMRSRPLHIVFDEKWRQVQRSTG